MVAVDPPRALLIPIPNPNRDCSPLPAYLRDALENVVVEVVCDVDA